MYFGGMGTVYFDRLPWSHPDKSVVITAPNNDLKTGVKVLLPCPDAIKESLFGVKKKLVSRNYVVGGQ